MSARPSDNLTVRPATPEDVPVILQFVRELAQYERLEQEVIATEERMRHSLFGPRPYAEVLLALVDAQPVGFAMFFHSFSTFLGLPGIYLEDLYVRPEARGHGVGRSLLARLAALTLERGCGRLEWSVLDWNAPSIGFYRSLGAQAMDDWTIFRVTGAALQRLASAQA
jgi:GNAT superfamily N-acetyltransferase